MSHSLACRVKTFACPSLHVIPFFVPDLLRIMILVLRASFSQIASIDKRWSAGDTGDVAVGHALHIAQVVASPCTAPTCRRGGRQSMRPTSSNVKPQHSKFDGQTPALEVCLSNPSNRSYNIESPNSTQLSKPPKPPTP